MGMNRQKTPEVLVMTEFYISKAEYSMDEDGLFGVEIGMGE